MDSKEAGQIGFNLPHDIVTLPSGGKFYKNNKFTMDNATLDDIRMLDDIMENNPIKNDITVYHGAKESPFRLWRKYRAPLDKPVLTHWPAFISTSTSIYCARIYMHAAAVDVDAYAAID